MKMERIFAWAAVACFVALGSAQAASEGYCRHYAHQAVWQYHRSQEIPDCYRGDNAVWSPDFYHHYRWCLDVSYDQARNGDDMRGSRLHACSMAAYGHP